MLKLGVNIDHVATLRQARYRSAHDGSGAIPEPDPVWAAMEVELAGAHGITVHLREDRRHIQDRDVRLLRQTIRTSLNLEMADVPEIIAFAEEVRPDEVCLVPEKRQEVTTEGGLNVLGAAKSLTRTVARLKKARIVVSLFVDPDARQIRAAADAGADFIELHTGTFANTRNESEQAAEIKKLTLAATLAHKLGLRVNAGHGLNYQNTPAILAVPHLETLNTGHSIISRALFVGLRQAVREMLGLDGPTHAMKSEGTRILGTGVDIVETARIQDSLDKFGERFLSRCFWPGEVAYCNGMKFPALHFAARFAAKEAISKAFGTGIGHHLGWKDMEIRKRDSGEPYAVLHGKGEELARARGVTEVFVSLSHSKDYAAAQAVIVGHTPSTGPDQ